MAMTVFWRKQTFQSRLRSTVRHTVWLAFVYELLVLYEVQQTNTILDLLMYGIHPLDACHSAAHARVNIYGRYM